jgi:alanine--tRNA ligase
MAALTKEALAKQFSKRWKELYALKVLEERGFGRKKCKKCGKYFWSCDKKRKLCGDSTCEPYSFIGKKFGWKHDYVDTWREFARFFQSKGRTVINRYPTVARWRDDTWFVQASIYDFQPHVVSGETSPPANPLVVAQPCFRFNDIENIGVTSRHYSNFVMIGQHRFVSENREDWKEDDIGLVVDVLKQFKIPEKALTFVENAWLGGGNAGPCFELFVGGMELLTTVFMQYAITENNELKDLPLKIIDFGWGLERLAWLVNGTATSYEVTFDPVDKKFAKLIGFKPDDAFLKKLSKVNANMDLTEEAPEKVFQRAAKALKMKQEALLKKLEPIRAFYSILDHSKTLLFAIADGALPSNTGGGYNLRVLLRRALRMGEKFNWPVDLVWLAREHAQALYGNVSPRSISSTRGEELSEADLMPMYPELRQSLPDVEKILEFEVKRYQESKQKISQFLDTFLKKKKTIDAKDLVQLYESQGALPEDVAAVAEKYNVKVKIPDNFYEMISAKHAKPKEKLQAKGIQQLKLPATNLLYYTSEKMREFDAKVLKIIDGRFVVLDKTAFYPTSGGQLCDIGNMNRKGSVVNVEKVGNVVLHEVEDINFKEGSIVNCELDWPRRQQLTRHHTAVHIVNGVCRAQLGSHVWQAGSEKTLEKARLDITHYQNLTKDELMKIEALANEIVLQALPVNKKILPRTQAEQTYTMRIYQGGVSPGNTVRILEIPGLDVEACGGTHCANTLEVGPIKILGSKRIQDGIIRIELVSGKRAIDEFQKGENYLQQSAQVFSVLPEQLPKTCTRFFDEWKNQRKEIGKLKSQLPRPEQKR